MQLFSDLDNSVDVDFSYSGDRYRYCKLKSDGSCRVLLTLTDTINRDIKLVNVYLYDKRIFGVRLHKDNITLYETEDIINRVYWEYIWIDND